MMLGLVVAHEPGGIRIFDHLEALVVEHAEVVTAPFQMVEDAELHHAAPPLSSGCIPVNAAGFPASLAPPPHRGSGPHRRTAPPPTSDNPRSRRSRRRVPHACSARSACGGRVVYRAPR